MPPVPYPAGPAPRRGPLPPGDRVLGRRAGEHGAALRHVPALSDDRREIAPRPCRRSLWRSSRRAGRPLGRAGAAALVRPREIAARTRRPGGRSTPRDGTLGPARRPSAPRRADGAVPSDNDGAGMVARGSITARARRERAREIRAAAAGRRQTLECGDPWCARAWGSRCSDAGLGPAAAGGAGSTPAGERPGRGRPASAGWRSSRPGGWGWSHAPAPTWLLHGGRSWPTRRGPHAPVGTEPIGGRGRRDRAEALHRSSPGDRATADRAPARHDGPRASARRPPAR